MKVDMITKYGVVGLALLTASVLIASCSSSDIDEPRPNLEEVQTGDVWMNVSIANEASTGSRGSRSAGSRNIGSRAAESQKLGMTFTRTGTNLNGVTVHTTGITGVAARLTSISHSLSTFSTTALCYRVNATVNPTIKYEFTISGLPLGHSISNIGLTTHAFNANGGNQYPDDNKQRQYNVDVSVNGTATATLADIDLATDNVGGIKNWSTDVPTTINTANPITITITVTKGTVNEGCYFGLEGLEITILPEENPVEPDDPIHTPEASAADENYIDSDLNSLTLLLLDDNHCVIQTFESKDYTISRDINDVSNRNYDLSFRVNQRVFDYAGQDITFHLLLVANKNGIGQGYDDLIGFRTQTFDYIAGQYKGFDYDGQHSGQPWTPSIEENRHIPMAGIRKFTMARAEMEAATERSKALQLSRDGNDGVLQMQRALAKIRVVDELEGSEGNFDLEKISSVNIIGATTRGTYIPVDVSGAWKNGTAHVDNATTNGNWYSSAKRQATVAMDNTDAKPAFVCYMSECPASTVANTVNGMKLEINTVDGNNNAHQYIVPFSQILADGNRAILRNHIYEISVRKVRTDVNIQIDFTVCEWQTASTNIEFN